MKGNCQTCRGTGRCEQCFGSGTNLHLSQSDTACRSCGGRGGCGVCNGTGHEFDGDQVSVAVRLVLSSLPIQQIYTGFFNKGDLPITTQAWLVSVCFWFAVFCAIWYGTVRDALLSRRQRFRSLFHRDQK